MAGFEAPIDAHFVLLVFQSRQLPVREAESPCLMIVRGAIRNPIGRLRETKKVLLEFRKSDATAHRNAVVDHVQVALREVHDLFALSVLDPSLPNVPFLRHRPIQNGSTGGHLAQHHRYSLLQIAEALAQSVSGDAATDGVEVPHHVVKGGPFLLEIERLDHFSEMSGGVQNGGPGQKSNVQSDSRSLAPLTSEILSNGFRESARSIIPTVHKSWRSTFTFNFAATARCDPCPRSRRLAGAIRCRASDHRSAPRRTCRAHRTRSSDRKSLYRFLGSGIRERTSPAHTARTGSGPSNPRR